MEDNWEYECDKYAQQQRVKLNHINAMEIAFGNMIDSDSEDIFIP